MKSRITIKDRASAIKRMTSDRLGRRARVGVKWYVLYLECSQQGDFSPMFGTDFYIKHGPEYCTMVEIVAHKNSSIGVV